MAPCTCMGGDHVCKPPLSSLAHAWRSFQEAPLPREADKRHYSESAAKKSRWARQRDLWAPEDGGELSASTPTRRASTSWEEPARAATSGTMPVAKGGAPEPEPTLIARSSAASKVTPEEQVGIAATCAGSIRGAEYDGDELWD